MKKKRKKINEKKLTIKLLLITLYLIVITILFVCSYKIYQDKNIIKPWSETSSIEDYTYIEISKMSEKFAYYEEKNIGIHFVIEKEDTGRWHTYLIAIDEKDYDKYKELIDYSYERTTTEVKPIKVYGYPVIVNNELKEMAINNIKNFVPAENEVTITEDNYETYLTNCYLDTTQKRKDSFSYLLLVTSFFLFVVIVLLIATILDHDKLISRVDKKVKEKLKIKK